jgi:hypothetical protein
MVPRLRHATLCGGMLRTSVVTVLPTHQGKREGGLSLGVLFAYAYVVLLHGVSVKYSPSVMMHLKRV